MGTQLIPVVIGVGDIVNRSLRVEDAREPLALMLDAIQEALKDTECHDLNALKHSFDSISIVRTWTWPYSNLPDLLSSELGIDIAHRHYSEHGGNQPAKLFDDAARRISSGQAKVAVIAGGEALASLNACAKNSRLPPPGWTKLDESVDSVFSPTNRKLEEGLGATHSIGAPIQIYPLYENGLRAFEKQSIHENVEESAAMYAEFSQVAEHNPYAWNYGRAADTKESIGTTSASNRMICFPYPLLMNAFNTVNLAAACILTSTVVAQELGIPRKKWIFPLGGAGTRDSSDFWLRPNYHSSPSISRSLDSALLVSGLDKSDVDILDIYSCFPIVPKLACRHLQIPTTKSSKKITLLGGLTSFGGAGNNYAMHSITAMVRELRKSSASHGLILANGGVVTYQHVICLSNKPRPEGLAYPTANPLPEVVDDVPVPRTERHASGEAIVETYTVDFDRAGRPLRGHVVGRLLRNNHRFLANHGDAFTLGELSNSSTEPIGKQGFVEVEIRTDGTKGRNLFRLNKQAMM